MRTFASMSAKAAARLTIYHKLGLVMAAMALPVVVVTSMYVETVREKIAFSERELHGVRLIRTIEPALTIAWSERGATPSPRLQRKRNAIMNAVGAALPFFDVRAEAMAFFDVATSNFASQNARTEASMRSGRALLQAIGDRSNLVLDPELHTFYLMEIITFSAPDLTFETLDLAQASEEITTVAGAPVAHAFQLGELIRAHERLAASVRLAAKHRVGKVWSDELETLTRSVGATVADLQKLPMPRRSSDLRSLREAYQQAKFRLNAQTTEITRIASADLEWLLALRIAAMSQNLWTALGLITLACLAGTGLSLLMARSLVVPYGRLATVTHSLAQNDLRVRVPYKTYKNEIGEAARQLEVFRSALIEREMLLADSEHDQRRLEERVKDRTAELEAASAKLTLAMRLAKAAVWSWDPRSDTAWSSPEFELLFGAAFTEAEMHDGMWRHIHPDDLVSARATLLNAQNGADVSGVEIRVLRKDTGALVWMQFGAVQRPDGTLVGVGLDVTKRKESELAIQRASAELAEQDRTLRLALQTSRAGVWSVNLKTRAVWSSPEFAAITGKPLCESDFKDGMWQAVHPDDHLPTRAVLDGRQPGRPIDFEHRIVTASGEILWVRACLLYEDHRVIGLIADITDRKLQELEIVQARAAADAANAAKSQFLATMSHEIRTPLNGVLGMASALQRTTLTPSQSDMVRVINSSGGLLLRLLNDLLDLSKIEAGEMMLEEETIDIVETLNDVAALFTGAAAEKGISFDIAAAEDVGAWRIGDPTRIRQAFQNLISNAIKFTEIGGVTCTLGRDGDAVVLTVRDTGIGMEEAQQQRLFKRFAQADGSIARRFGGTGLGLSIVQDLAELMGGSVSVSSTLGEGSVFTLRLALPETRPPQDMYRSTEAPTRGLGAIRILGADDNETNRLVLRTLLEPLDFEVVLTINGKEAVAAAEVDAYDLILMDVHMPVMDGISAARAIRCGSGPNATTPIIALTADALPQTIAACRDAGMNSHCEKPIVPAKLFAAIQRLLEPQDQDDEADVNNAHAGADDRTATG